MYLTWGPRQLFFFLARNPGMFPDLELNRQPLGSQARAQSTELHQPGALFLNPPPRIPLWIWGSETEKYQ